jgi:hydroxyethylthiazole kinase-like uncharacterized protein yjeF
LIIEGGAVPGYTLMSRAGEAVMRVLRERWPTARRLVVVCGTGNNGGDGYITARLATEAGLQVTLLQLGEEGRIRGDALSAAEAFREAGGAVLPFDEDRLASADVLVDAVLGTGLERPLEGAWRGAVESMNRTATPVIAVDIPTGLHADTGCMLGATIRASCTVTFIGRKQGLYTGEAPDYTGRIVFDDLQTPAEIHARVPASSHLLMAPPLGALDAPRLRTAHKGHFGHALIVGGDYGMSGAVRLAGEAAARTGAGLVSIATRPEHAVAITSGRPELMCHGILDRQQLWPLLGRATVAAIGPGMGRSAWARDLLMAVMESRLPLVVDADALNLLAMEPARRAEWVLTPHPGEAGRLLSSSSAEVQRDRFAAVRALSERYNGVCVLKGAGTLICEDGAHVSVCPAGNPGMASGGMGDVLSGVIAGLVAQGLDLPQAAGAGVCIHGHAADRAARHGERGMLASDVLAELRHVVNRPGSGT